MFLFVFLTGAELTGEHDREHGEEKETEDMEGQSRNRDKPHLENESEEEEGEGDGHEDEEEEMDDPEFKELNRRMGEVSQSRDLEEIRKLHEELHLRHVVARQDAVRRITNLI